MSKHIVEAQIYDKARKEWTDAGRLCGVNHLLPRAVARCGDKQAIIGFERTVTYSQLWYYVLVAAEWLMVRGVSESHRVVLYIPNSIDFYCAYFAAWHVGAVVVPLNVYLHAREIAAILQDAGPTVIVTTLGMQESLAAALALLPGQHPAVVAIDQYLWDFSYSPKELAERERVLLPVVRLVDEVAVILYTSGSTGAPKGVVLSGRNVMVNTLQTRARLEKTLGSSGAKERFFAVLPLFHAFSQIASVWLPIMLGATSIVVPKIDRRALMHGLELKPTIFFGFPALFGLLIMMRNAPIQSINLFVSGADALPDKIRMAFSLMYGRKICSGYGLTEASPVIAVDGEGEDYPTNMVGRPVVGVTCQVRDDEGNPLPIGTVGTLWVSGENIMQGYYNEPVMTAQVIQNGWLNTGDLATIDAEGCIAIVGRSKDLIINKGFNIYPQEVENVLLRHPAIYKAAVIGKEEDGGEVPVAYVALREGTKVIPAEVTAFCRENLASYKVPRVVTCLPDLPMTATGKVDKKVLRAKRD